SPPRRPPDPRPCRFPYTTLFRSIRTSSTPSSRRGRQRGRSAMRPFVFERVDNAAAAVRAFGAQRSNAQYLAGGTTLLDLMKLDRSEEHTSEVQSRENLVCRLVLE